MIVSPSTSRRTVPRDPRKAFSRVPGRVPRSSSSISKSRSITGAFIRNVEGRIAELEADPSDASTLEAAELRDVLRLGRLLLNGHEVSL